MQFIEVSAIGVRSARYRFATADGKVRVTVYPMVHVGEADFFQQVYGDADKHDLVLVEGVSGKTTRGLTRSYRFVGKGRTGLIVQPRPRQIDKAKILNADLDGGKFDAFMRRVSFKERALLWIGAPIFGLYMRYFATRRMIGQHLAADDLRSARQIASDDIKVDPFGYAIKKARDDHLRTILRRRIESMAAGGGGNIAVIFGAGHARAIVRELRAMGMSVEESSWHMLFSY